MHLNWLKQGLILFSSFAVMSVFASSPSVDRILINGTIITMDSKNSILEAMAIKDGKILAVGDNPSILEYKGNEKLSTKDR